jgi:hypothetical protein
MSSIRCIGYAERIYFRDYTILRMVYARRLILVIDHFMGPRMGTITASIFGGK